MTPGRWLPRPRRAGIPAAGTLLVLGVWAVVAHDSGSGWTETVGALVAGGLLVGLLGPAIAVSTARCSVVSAPADAVAGQPFTVDVVSGSAVEIRPVRPSGPPTLRGAAPRCTLVLRPEHRGMLDRCTVVVATAAPFGIAWWTRTVVLPLPRPVAVAPRVEAPDPPSTRRAGASVDHPSPLVGHGSETRGVRPYRRGDRPHLVHWPATAHAGTLMVRETARPAVRVVAVRAVLPDDPAAAEAAAECVMGTVAGLLAAGACVRLVTAGPEGDVTDTVTSVGEAGRLLAMAPPSVDAATGGRP